MPKILGFFHPCHWAWLRLVGCKNSWMRCILQVVLCDQVVLLPSRRAASSGLRPFGTRPFVYYMISTGWVAYSRSSSVIATKYIVAQRPHLLLHPARLWANKAAFIPLSQAQQAFLDCSEDRNNRNCVQPHSSYVLVEYAVVRLLHELCFVPLGVENVRMPTSKTTGPRRGKARARSCLADSSKSLSSAVFPPDNARDGAFWPIVRRGWALLDCVGRSFGVATLNRWPELPRGMCPCHPLFVASRLLDFSRGSRCCWPT